MRSIACLLLSLGLLATPLIAQVGTPDQTAPFTTEVVAPQQSAGFNGSASSLVWQAQVKAGLTGQLEGFELELSAGPTGANLDVRVKMGGGWNTSGAVFSTTLTKAVDGREVVFVDVTSAGISLVAGDLFVIEMQGNDTGTNIGGSYVPPASGPPAYGEFLYLNGPGCYSNCGWRIGFHTFVLTGPPVFTLSTNDSCPGSMTFDIVGATANGTVALAYSIGQGSFPIPANKPCGGLQLGLDPSSLVLIGTQSASGSGTTSFGAFNVPAKACGKVSLQAVDLNSCTASNVLDI